MRLKRLGLLGILGAPFLVAARPASQVEAPATVWVQTMDSCSRALGGARYELSNGVVTLTATTPWEPWAYLGMNFPAAACPLQHGRCSNGFTPGCVEFTGVPFHSTYVLSEIRTPARNTRNPEGYAACNGGSACRHEHATVTIDSVGNVTAEVVNVDPDGTPELYPGTRLYAATAADPIVFHDAGLAPPGFDGNPQCDGDSDADDHNAVPPGPHCQYQPEGAERVASEEPR